MFAGLSSQQLLIIFHEHGQSPPPGTQQPADGEEGGDEVDAEHEESNEEDVEVELRGYSGTFIEVVVNVTNDVEILLNLKFPSQPQIRSQTSSNQELENCPDEVALVEVPLLLE